MKAWDGFQGNEWKDTVNVRDFIQNNYTPYHGDDEFLAGCTERTKNLWEKAEAAITEEIREGKVQIDTTRFSGIANQPPGYLNREEELIHGFQSDEPLKRLVNPYGGYRMVKDALKAYDHEMDPELEKAFTAFRKTHNDGVFDAYTKEMKKARSAGLLSGLPDAYGRGRIIGDYRRMALYGTAVLKEEKLREKDDIRGRSVEETIKLREEMKEQIRAIEEMEIMAKSYGYDITRPAENAREAIQFFYFAYLAAVKENNGAAMSLGRNTAFFDIYIERDLQRGVIDEEKAQELIDDLVIKLRMVRHLRTPEYNELFAGDPNWITEAIGGMGRDGRTLVTRTAYRFLHTLSNLGAAPEPNMTVLWSEELPEAFKNYCSRMSLETGAIQYENDDLMRPIYGDDYGIACCVSAMKIGKEMQFFGARANLGKALLYAINGGRDEIKVDGNKEPVQLIEGIEPLEGEVLDYEAVMENFRKVNRSLAKLYVETMNTIHYMHDQYAYEASQMALHDSLVHRYMAFGVAGLSIVADSLSAIKFGEVRPIRNEQGIAVDFDVTGAYPTYGNDDDRVDEIAVQVLEDFSEELKKTETYRNAEHTLSVLTITSNVVYGKKTGTTPDGRKKGEPFAPGANPMHGRDQRGALASLNSVAKLPYDKVCKDGISNTFSITPKALGKAEGEQIINLSSILDGYFAQGAFHLNVNAVQRSVLEDAMEHPEKYPLLTLRVSGYAVHFNRLTREQKEEVLARTFHESA